MNSVPAAAPAARRPAGRHKLSRARKFTYLCMIAFAPVLFLLAAGEGGGRFWMWWKHGVPGKTYGLYVTDRELGATHKPHSYNSNSVTDSQGLRRSGEMSRPKPPGALRVLCSGGSTTFCYNLTTNQAWPTRLEARLRSLPGHASDEVLNAGQICFSVAHELILARRLVSAVQPDVVLIYSGINEPMNAGFLAGREQVSLDELLAAGRWGVAARKLDQAGFLIRHSVLARFFQYFVQTAIRNLRAKTGPAREAARASVRAEEALHPWVTFNYEKTLEAYIRYLRSQSVRPMVVRFGDNGNPTGLKQIRELRERGVALARRMGADVCDVAAAIEIRPDRRDLFISTGLHVTERGAAVVAEVMGECLLREPAADAAP